MDQEHPQPLTGTYSDWNINLAGAQGQQGSAGAAGPQGPQGPPGPIGYGYQASSTTPLPIATGSITVATQSGLAYTAGARVRLSSNGTPTAWMEGLVTSYSGSTMQVTVDLRGATTGTFSDWNINLAGQQGVAGPTGGSSVYVSDTAPTGVADNSQWWESDTGVLYVRYNDGDSTQWVVAVTSVGSSAPTIADVAPPTNGTPGSLWWNSAQGTLYVLYNDGDSVQWVVASPQASQDGLVRFDTAQTLTDSQKAQARTNVYAAPFDALAFNGMQVNGSCDVSQERVSTTFAVTAGTVTYIQDGWRFIYGSAPLSINVAPRSGVTLPGFRYGFSINAAAGKPALAATDYVLVDNVIEGNRVFRLGWGTAAAQPISIGFYVLATIAGTMTVCILNGAANRTFITDVVIHNPNTWEYKTLTVPGDTAGTWANDNTLGLIVRFSFGAGSGVIGPTGSWQAGGYNGSAATTNFMATNGNQCAITGLIVLPGIELPSASRVPLIMRPYDQELPLCRRYYFKSYDAAFTPGTAIAQGQGKILLPGAPGGTYCSGSVVFPVSLRVAPTITYYNQAGTPGAAAYFTTVWVQAGAISSVIAGENAVMFLAPTSGAANMYNFDLVADARL